MKLWLVSHPPIKEISEHLSVPEGFEDSYDKYTGAYPDIDIANATNLTDVFKEIEIHPRVIEGVSNELGRLIITGITREGESATVDINPFKDINWKGYIYLEK